MDRIWNKDRAECFNSLQTGRRIQSWFAHPAGFLYARFQFPSNGKADTKAGSHAPDQIGTLVSIPFKREGGSKGCQYLNAWKDITKCFNSLQTGRRIQSISIDFLIKKCEKLFQFPSNGKAYPKQNYA